MHIAIFVAFVTALALTTVAGVAAVATGWVFPWQQGRIVRPRIWGYGSLLWAASMALFRYGSTVHGMPDIAFDTGMVALVTGSVLQIIGTRARAPRA